MKDNALIAEFMGAMPVFNNDGTLWIDCVFLNGMHCLIERPKEGTLMPVLFYEHSWDWLIPVVEKIEGMGYQFKIYQNWASIFELNRNQLWEMTADTKIEATYTCITHFIKYLKEKR